MTIQAIETSYRGRYFRSRLEARWAVFLDVLNIEWVHEPDSYSTRAGWYLPDFQIVNGRDYIFIEIKPYYPNSTEQAKCFGLAEHFNSKYIFFCCGLPGAENILCVDAAPEQDAYILSHQHDKYAFWRWFMFEIYDRDCQDTEIIMAHHKAATFNFD